MAKLILISLGLLFSLASMACQKSTSPDETDLELDAVFEEHAAVGWEINDLVMSSNEITELTGNVNYIENDGVSDYTSMTKLKTVGKELNTVAQEYLYEGSIFLKPTADNIIYKINFDRYGKAIISKDGKSKEINLYQ